MQNLPFYCHGTEYFNSAVRWKHKYLFQKWENQTSLIELDFTFDLWIGDAEERQRREWFWWQYFSIKHSQCSGSKRASISITTLLSGAAVVIQHMQVTNHCHILAIWGWLEMSAIICLGQQFVGATVLYDGLALQLKVPWPISLHLLWTNIAKQRLLLFQFQGQKSNL